jgi:type IV pilus assembly protein PilC
MMIAVVVILVTAVLPIFNEVFARLGSRMSPMAVSLMNIGDWLTEAAVVIAAVFAALFIALLLVWLIPTLRNGAAALCRNTLGSHGVFREMASARFISSLSMALASGMNTDDAITIAAVVGRGPKVLTKRYELCKERLLSGSMLPEAIQQAGIISMRDSRFLTLGGASGMADEAMSDIARRAEQSIHDRIDAAVGRIEPALVITTSLIVGVVLLSVMLPLMGIMTALG